MIYFSLSVMIAAIFLSGIAAQKVLKLPFSISNAIMVGFLSLLAVFHVIAYPMMRLNTSFTLLFWVYSCVLLLIVLLALVSILRRDFLLVVKNHILELWSSLGRELPVVFLMFGMMAATFCISYFYAFESSDDSYYLPRVMEILAQNKLGVSQGLAWTGLAGTSFPENVDPSTLECWKAYWSYLFHIHPTVFCRVTLTCVVHFVSWCSLYQAFRSITRHTGNPTPGCIFLIVYLFFLLLDNQLNGGLPLWTVRYPAQGKSILLSIIYPALLSGCAWIIDLDKNPIPWTRWCMLSITLTAGIASTIVGIFWAFLCCVSLGLPYLILVRRKDLGKLLLPLILTSLPVIIYAGISYFLVVTEQPRYFAFETPNWFDNLKYAVNYNRLDLFVFCLAFTCLCGSRTANYLLIGGTATLLLGILNPLLVPVVSKYLTTGDVYFRLFWMLPIYFTVAYAAAEMLGSRSVRIRQILAGSLTAILVLGLGIGLRNVSPRELYLTINYELQLATNAPPRINGYGLSYEWCTLAQTLLEGKAPEERVQVMWISQRECLLRQYSAQIVLPGACRDSQWKYADLTSGNCDVSLKDIHDAFVGDDQGDFTDPDWAHTQLVLSEIEFLCVDSTSGFSQRKPLPSGFELVSVVDNISVYRIIR